MAPFFVQGSHFLPWKDAAPAEKARVSCFNSTNWTSGTRTDYRHSPPALDSSSTGRRIPSRVGERGHPLLPAWSIISSFPQLANSSSIFTSQAKLYSFPMGFTNPQAKPGSLTYFCRTTKTCKIFLFATVCACTYMCGGWLDICLSKEAGCSQRTRIKAVLLLIRARQTNPKGFAGGAVVKNPPATARDTRDMGSVPGLGRFPGGGHGSPLQCSCLENSMDRGAWVATDHGVSKSQAQLGRHTDA